MRDRRPPCHDYQLMVNALADATRRRDADLTGAEQAYRDSAARRSEEGTRYRR
jgi:hypothetical protein